MFNRITCILIHNVFKSLCVPGQFRLVVTNMLGTAKVLGSNLSKTCFFFKRELICFKYNCRTFICLLICCRLSFHFLDCFFYLGFLFSFLFGPHFVPFLEKHNFNTTLRFFQLGGMLTNRLKIFSLWKINFRFIGKILVYLRNLN